MDKVKIKVIGVLRERGVVNHKQQQQQQHQVGVGVSAATGVTAVVVNGVSVGSGVAQDSGAVNGLGQNGVDEQVASTVDGGGSGIGGGGAARTSILTLARPQVPKLSALDLAGILNTRRRLEWTKEWLRKNQTEFLSKENILSESQFRNNESNHLNYFLAITESQFRFLVQKLEPEISQYAPQRKKKSFSAEERLAITLKYLATGEVHSCRNYCFRASKPVIFRMIANICLSFFTQLKDQYLQLPKTDEQWKRLAAGMQQKHEPLKQCVGNLFMREIQFHNANGSCGGNSSNNSSSSASGSSSTDERKQSPLIISGLVDNENNFLHVDVEYTPANAHNEIYEHATLKEMLEQQVLPLPANKICNNGINSGGGGGGIDGNDGSYYFIGDSALPQKSYLITAQNSSAECSKLLDTYNVHTEETLRILCNMFPILAQPMRINAQHTRDIVLGCVALYNFLRKTDDLFRQRSDNIVKQPWEPFFAEPEQEDSDDDCIMLASEEELRERAEFTPSIGLTTCFQCLSAQTGDTAEGVAKREWLLRQQKHQNGGANFC